MSFEGKNKKYFLIIIALLIIAVNAIVILGYLQENSPGSSLWSYSRSHVVLSVPDPFFVTFNPGHLLMTKDPQYSGVPMQNAPSVFSPTISVNYNLSDKSFFIEDDFDDKYSFDYYLNNSGENLSVIYSPDAELNKNNLSFDILVLNTGNTDIELLNITVSYRVSQVNGQCSVRKKLPGYDPGVLISPGGFSEIRVEVPLLSPDGVKNLGMCKYFDENIPYSEYVRIEVIKKGSSYPYGTTLDIIINPVL